MEFRLHNISGVYLSAICILGIFMRRSRSHFTLTCCLAFFLPVFCYGIENTCEVSPLTPNRELPNMFSSQQEVEFGEVLAEMVRKNSYAIDDQELDAYLQSLGDGLVKRLPHSDLKFRFFLSHLPYLNAFSIAGGRVYVSRK